MLSTDHSSAGNGCVTPISEVMTQQDPPPLEMARMHLRPGSKVEKEELRQALGDPVSAAIVPSSATDPPGAAANQDEAGKAESSSCSSVTDEDEQMEEEGAEAQEAGSHTEISQIADEEEPEGEDDEEQDVKQKRKYKSRKYMKKQLICGHDEKPYHAKGLCKNCYQRELERRKYEKTGQKRKNKPIVYKCPHVVGQAYKNKMCKECCYAQGITRKRCVIDRCEHTDRKYYGKGLCKKCYRKEEYRLEKEKRLRVSE